MTELDAIVVNHNTRDALRVCLSALVADPCIAQIFVADNGSTDGSIGMVRAEFANVDVRSFPDNPGYGAAINRLMAVSTAASVLCLNADVRVRPGCAEQLADHLDNHPDVALVGPSIRDSADRLQRSVFPEPSLRDLAIRETGIKRLLESLPIPRKRSHGDGPVVWVLGALMAIRRDSFEEIGGFDEGFFLYFEEVDLCQRLREAGWSIGFVPSATADHIGGASTSQRRMSSQRTYYRSLHRYHEIHRGASLRRLALLVRLIMSARLARDRIRCCCGHAGACRDLKVWSTVRAEARMLWRANLDPVDRQARRHDWMQLLPVGSGSAELIGEFDALEQDAICERLGRVFDRRQLDGPDIVIAHVRGAAELRCVAASIRSGGVGYIECAPTGLRCPPLQVRRILQRCGVELKSSHWLVPNERQPRCYVPVDHAGALRWYLDEQFVPKGRLEALARRLIGDTPRLAWMLPGAHAHIAVRPPRSDSEPVLLGALRDQGLDVAREDALLLMTSGQDAGSRSIVLPFPAGSSTPSMTVKVSGQPAINETSLREHRTLVELRKELPSWLAATVPAPKSAFEWQGRTVTVESFLAGPTVDAVLRERTLRHLRPRVLDAVTSWVIDLHRATSDTSERSPRSVSDWTEPVFSELLEVAAPTNRVHSLIERARAESRVLDSVAVPSVRRHLDLAPWNLIWTEQGIGAVDWESAGVRPADGRGLPFCDLDYFVKYYLHATCPTDDPAAQAALSPYLSNRLVGVRPEVTEATQALLRYLDEMSLDARLVPLLVVYNWSEHAVNRQRRDRLLGVPPGGELPTLQFLDTLAEDIDRFFDAPLR